VHTQQLRGFDESHNDQGSIQNRSAKINTTVASLSLPASSFTFRILRLAQKMERIKIVFTVQMEVKMIRKGFYLVQKVN
jgi:hypothetical protein